MSYTMTLDVPDQTAAYVERRGPRYRAELNAIFVAIVEANMKSDEAEARRERKAKKAVAVQRMDGVSPLVQSLCGVVSLPPDFDDKNIRAEATLEKYESIS